ncbi:cyanophycinase [Chitinophaga filiformis]|uniref:cyanophycinase n=1 Tax=Chitinophaga filiformis TaxID=104663 RepID=UPI001F25D47D|nr:cyanophycinase [Chitinophaga filiformis]MCF6402638.1 cyanophycinase [Chitinophaga filiformis]MCF6403444.1 cyanophycinase [Chitinophaga filiformis]
MKRLIMPFFSAGCLFLAAGAAAQQKTAATAQSSNVASAGVTQSSNTVQADAVIGPQKGALIIVGGGKVGPEIWARFIELAGGPNANIVVIPTAGEDSALATGKSFEKELLQDLGVAQVTVLHTRDLKVANTESFVAPLKKATGIWFPGGRQWKIADAYLHTLAEKEIKAVLTRGGVIGGTSAGATIQGSFLLRGDTKGNGILEGDHVQGLDLIHHTAIDQHILRRNRQFDLVGVIKAHPDLLGIGIDESTAIVVQKDTFEVVGNSYVAIYDIAHINEKQKSPTGEYSTDGPFYFLGRGQRFDLQQRKVITTANRSAAVNAPRLSNDH